MKKLFFSIGLLLTVSLATVVFNSCGDDKDEPIDQNDPNDPSNPNNPDNPSNPNNPGQSNKYDWIQATQSITYAANGVTEQSRTEISYDTEGRQIGYKQYSNGVLSLQYRDYQYNGRIATFWGDYYLEGSLNSSFKYQTTYSERNWIQTTQSIIYAANGVTEQSRTEISYDTEGRQIGYKQYSNGVLLLQYRDYQYNGRIATFWCDYYLEGSVNSSFKCQTTYSERN
jgi:hypothetical protein